MCFSETADVVAATGVGVVGVACLTQVRHRQEVLFAALPLLFALHQLVEVFVWRGLSSGDHDGLYTFASTAYVAFAVPFLPLYVPLAVTVLEPPDRRRRVAPFVALGGVVCAYLTYAMATNPIQVRMESHAISYSFDLSHGETWAVLYVVATIGPAILSGYRSVEAFGVANFVGLVAVAVLYVEAFASLWCVMAAVLSVLVLVHLRRRHRLLDPAGHPLPGHRMPKDPVPCTTY